MRKLYFKIMAVLFAGTIAVVGLTGCKYGAPPPRNNQDASITEAINVTPSAAPTSLPTTTPVNSLTNG